MADGIGYAKGDPANTDRCGSGWAALTATDADTIAAAGFNFVRLGIGWAPLEPTAPVTGEGGTVHTYNAAYLTALDGIIKLLAARGIAVVLDMHQAGWSPAFQTDPKLCEGSGMPAWLYPDEPDGGVMEPARCAFYANTPMPGAPSIAPQDGLADAWAMLAKRYASTAAVVGVDLFNELPLTTGCTPQGDAVYAKLGGAVRKASSRLVLLYEDNAYTSYVGSGGKSILTQPLALPNTIYSWHFYPPDWATGQPYYAAHLARAQQWNVPFWIGEFSAFSADQGSATPEANWQTDLATMFGDMRKNEVSWSLWAYDDGSYSILAAGSSPTPKQPLVKDLLAGF
jgi:hypothetical protein